MKQKSVVGLAALTLSALLLAGCSTGDGVATPTDSAAPGGEVSEAIDYAEKWESAEPVELLFPRGEYTFTYSEDLKTSGQKTWSGEGRIAFYEDGTCAFDFEGTRVDADGKKVDYRLIKTADSYPIVKTAEYSDAPVWLNDQMIIESSYRTNYPSMGAFPRYKDFASFCSMQKLGEIGQRGGAEVGYFFWDTELGAEYAKESKEWYYDFMLTELKIEPKDYAEARKVLDLMYYGADNIFTYDGQGKVDVRDDGKVIISTGLDKEDNFMTAQMALTPSKKPLLLELGNIGDDLPIATIQESLAGYVANFKGGIEYLRDIQKTYDEYAKKSEGTTTESGTTESDN